MKHNDKPQNSSSPNFAPRAYKDGALKNQSTYEEFILWYALPRPGKLQMKLETQELFAKYYGVSERTLNNWKARKDFLPQVKVIRDQWGNERTPDVIEAIYQSAIGGGREAPQAQKLWLQYVEGFNEKAKPKEAPKEPLTVNDILFIIKVMPEEYHDKFYSYIREINDTACALMYSGEVENTPVPEEDLLYLLEDKENLPIEAKTGLPFRYQSCIFTNERKTFSSYYRGAENVEMR